MIIEKFKSNIQDKITAVSTAVFSVLFAIFFVLTVKVHFSGNILDKLTRNYLPDFTVWDPFFVILTAAVVFCMIHLIIIVLDSQKITDFFESGESGDAKKLFKSNFIITALLWFICFLTFFPGVGMNDTLWIIKKPVEIAGQHPILYTMFLSGCYNLGKTVFSSAIAGIAIYSVIQMLIMNLCVSHCVTYYYKIGCPKTVARIIGLSFAILPIVADYSITAVKDTLFSTFMMLFIPLLYETAESDGGFLRTKKGALNFILLGLLIMLIRNNGVYVMFGISVIIFFMFKNIRKIIIPALCAVIVIGSIPNTVLKSMGIESLFQESVAIPLQQISMVVAKDRVEDEKDIEFIENLLPMQEIKSNYAPMSVDKIKWDGNFNAQFLNDHPREFLSLWFKLLWHNKMLYAKAYLLETYGFWSIGTHNGNQAVFFDITNTATNMRLKAYLAEEGLKNQQVFPNPIHNFLVSYYRTFSKYIGAGSCFWLSMFIALMLIVRKKYKHLLLLMPCTIVWLTLMISAPVAFAFRYVFMYVMCLPFFLVLPMLSGKKKI